MNNCWWDWQNRTDLGKCTLQWNTSAFDRSLFSFIVIGHIGKYISLYLFYLFIHAMFVITSGLHSLNIILIPAGFVPTLHIKRHILIPTLFCIYPGLHSLYTMIPAVFQIYLWPALPVQCWFLQCFVFIHGLHSLYTALIPSVLYLSMAWTPCTLCWFLQHFVFIRGLHSRYAALIPTAFCSYPWPALPVHCADSYSVLYLSVACTRREVIPGSWAECPASGTMKNSASGHLWNTKRERSSQHFMTKLYYNSLLLTSHSNSTLLLLFTFI